MSGPAWKNALGNIPEWLVFLDVAAPWPNRPTFVGKNYVAIKGQELVFSGRSKLRYPLSRIHKMEFSENRYGSAPRLKITIK